MTLLRGGSAALLLPLLATAAAAQASKPVGPPASRPAKRKAPSVVLKRVASLGTEQVLGAAFSADGRSLLFVKQVRLNKRWRGVVVRCGADGKTPVEVFTTGVHPWRIQRYFGRAMFRPDGGLVLPAVLGDADTVRPVVINSAGVRREVGARLPSTLGFGYAGRDLIVLEGAPQGGYALVRHGKAREELEAPAARRAYAMQVAPGGAAVALVLDGGVQDGVRMRKVRVVDLRTKRAVESPAIRPGGVRSVRWGPGGRVLYYDETLVTKAGRMRGDIKRFEPATGKTTSVDPKRSLFLSGLLGKHLLVVVDRLRMGVVRADGKLFPFPHDHTVSILATARDRAVMRDSFEPKPEARIVRVTLPAR